MLAIPDPGYVFAYWTPANVFTMTEYTIDADGTSLQPMVSTVWSPWSDHQRAPLLTFSVQPVTVILDVPGIEAITESRGWIATFVPINKR